MCGYWANFGYPRSRRGLLSRYPSWISRRRLGYPSVPVICLSPHILPENVRNSGLKVVALILDNRPPIRFLRDFALHVRCGYLAQVPDMQRQLIRHRSASEERKALFRFRFIDNERPITHKARQRKRARRLSTEPSEGGRGLV